MTKIWRTKKLSMGYFSILPQNQFFAFEYRKKVICNNSNNNNNSRKQRAGVLKIHIRKMAEDLQIKVSNKFSAKENLLARECFWRPVSKRKPFSKRMLLETCQQKKTVWVWALVQPIPYPFMRLWPFNQISSPSHSTQAVSLESPLTMCLY